MTVVDLADARRQRQSSPSPADGVDTLDRMLVGRRGLSPVLIGRSGAIDGLRVLVGGRSADPDNLPNVALVAGEAGIGKSRLLRELVGTLHRRHGRAHRPRRARLARSPVRQRPVDARRGPHVARR